MKLLRTTYPLFVVPLVAILVGCEPSKPVDKNKTAQDFVDSRIRLVKIENCEYIVTSFQPLVITHKGNCTNHK